MSTIEMHKGPDGSYTISTQDVSPEGLLVEKIVMFGGSSELELAEPEPVATYEKGK